MSSYSFWKIVQLILWDPVCKQSYDVEKNVNFIFTFPLFTHTDENF